ncbi:4-hydroxy-tetrahydrodipicolinate synthase [Clostridiaceae bacterium 35-E11]
MFHGIYTPIVTPFKENEEIDYGKMKHNLERWGKTDLDGIVVLGSNGEFVYLSLEEKLELVKFVIGNFHKDKKIIVGTGCESTKETIQLSNKMADLGADAVLVLPPHYFKGGMKEEILYQHFVDVANESKVPVMLYNMPGNTGINLSASLVANLAKHPNIVGIKDTSGNIVQITEIVRDADDDFAVFAGNAGYLLPALSVGARGATLALANILPEDCCKLVTLFKAGRMEEAKALQLKMMELNFTVTGKWGIPALKAALDLLGYQGGNPRRPLKPLSEEKRQALKHALVKYGILK